MSSAGSNPFAPPGREPSHRPTAGPALGRYATGQFLALVIVVLLGLPLLPLILLIIAAVRYRNRRGRDPGAAGGPA